MSFSEQKKKILKKEIKKSGMSNFPELDVAGEVIRREFPISTKGTRRQTNIKGDIESFGNKLKDPAFKKQFKKLQEKYKVTTFA